jgi:hypothetical protein
MNFYFINENNECTRIIAHGNKQVYEVAMAETKKQTTNSGFIGAIDNNHRLRASLLFTWTDNKVYTKLNGFIRKYAALGVLEKYVELLKAESMG